MGNINWKVRFKNPVFWAQLIAAIVLPLVVGVGASWEDMTSWATLGSAIVQGLSNPVVFVSMVVSLWTCVTDPTTSGTADSATALSRTEVKPNVTHDAAA